MRAGSTSNKRLIHLDLRFIRRGKNMSIKTIQSNFKERFGKYKSSWTPMLFIGEAMHIKGIGDEMVLSITQDIVTFRDGRNLWIFQTTDISGLRHNAEKPVNTCIYSTAGFYKDNGEPTDDFLWFKKAINLVGIEITKHRLT